MRFGIGKSAIWGLLATLALAAAAPALAADAPARFQAGLAPGLTDGPVTGRIIIAVSTKFDSEPRRQIGLNGPALFGADAEQLTSGRTVTIDAGADAFPIDSLRSLPAGEYYVQALLVRYTKATRSDGHTIWVPAKHERNSFNELEGNLYSDPQKLRLDPKKGFDARFVLSHAVPPATPLADTKWIKYVRIKSELLSKFWGFDTYLGAAVLLPRGFDEHPQARYPAVYAMSHSATPYSFSETPATPGEVADAKSGNVQTGFDFQKSWTSDGFPRVAAIAIFQSSPYFAEGYAVDSVNNGPYGKAITTELIPYLEKTFRLIPEPYARVVQGASTGGWESLALQLNYPDYFGGAWVFNPDPISFEHWQTVNIYKDDNMLVHQQSPWLAEERPFRRTVEGQPTITMREMARFEAVHGSRGRSARQFDIWHATYGPIGADGYPVQLFDKKTGRIDRKVAEYMRENGYDLTELARRNWPVLGPKLRGKLNFFSGEMDNFYLNLAVYDFQDMLRTTAGADYPARFEYGRPKKGHGWHLTDFADMLREIAAHMRKSAPAGADQSQWNY